MKKNSKNKSTEKTGLETFDHVVVLMLENRSFDNLLGYLYKEDGVPTGKDFEGLQNGEISNEIPKRALKDSDANSNIYTRPAKSYHQPIPDPGEPYQQVNTQLYNTILPNEGPKSNINKSAAEMSQPYNIPSPEPKKPGMNGFVNDYINKLQVEKEHGELPTEEEFSVIMECFEPKKLPVLATLAKEFAVFDHWFCSVPSQTWCNRAFWHAGTSGGKVINPINIHDIENLDLEPQKQWEKSVWTKPTILSRLTEKKIPWSVYAPDFISITLSVNGPTNLPFHKISRFDKFYDDIEKHKLPAYSFLEPKYMGQHNDQHPSAVNKPTRDGTVLLGEKLTLDVYNAIRNSKYYSTNTLLIITHDEHGGTFDHVPPPSTIAPDDSVGEKGFDFERLGVRVPMVMVSACIKPNTIVNDVHDHTSFLRTMCKKWDLKPLAKRDAKSKSFESIFCSTPRPASSWPKIKEPDILKEDDSKFEKDPLNDLQQALLFTTHNLAHSGNNLEFDFERLKSITTVGEARKHMNELIKMIKK